MADPLRAVFRLPFPEQVAAFRLRLGDLVPTARWDDLWQEAHDRAFMVAGATKADLLADLAGAVDKAISEGTSLEEFRRDFRDIVERHGWHGWTGEDTEAGQAWRTRVIYRTNARTTYAAGRYAQLTEGGFAFWIYRHGGSLEPRLQHLGWDGLILEADHPFWQTHYPPNGWGCSCYVTGARSIEDARRRGGDPDVELGDDWQSPDPKTGAPEGIDRGWAYAPGRSVAEDVNRMVAEKVAKLPARIGAALVASKPPDVPITPPPIPEATSLKHASNLSVELGLSQHPINWPRGADLKGVNQIFKALVETERRFDMKPLQAIGSAAMIAKSAKGLRNNPKAAAWFAPGYNVMGFNKSGLDVAAKSERLIRAYAASRAETTAAQRRRIAKMPDGPARKAAEHTDFDWTVAAPDHPEFAYWVAVHETGHRLHFNFKAEFDAAIEGWKQSGWQEALSAYGSTNSFEFVAESFVLYIMGPSNHWRIKPELLDLFKHKDRQSG